MVPASPLPVTVVPSSETFTSSACVGTVVSGAETVVATDSLPALSVNLTETSSPFVNAGSRATENSPFAGTVTVPSSLPFASVTVTVVPGSPLPVTVAPSVDTATSVAADGTVLSVHGTSVELPAASVTTTLSVVLGAGVVVTEKLPSASAVPEPITLPF